MSFCSRLVVEIGNTFYKGINILEIKIHHVMTKSLIVIKIKDPAEEQLYIKTWRE